jgi:hypothetical protein
MSPVAERESPTVDEPLVSQPDTSALFMARRSDLRLVKKSIKAVRGPEGEVLDHTAGQTVLFRDGALRVPLDPKGKVVLANGDEAKAGEILEWIRHHKLKGDSQEGCWEVDPTAPRRRRRSATRCCGSRWRLMVLGCGPSFGRRRMGGAASSCWRLRVGRLSGWRLRRLRVMRRSRRRVLRAKRRRLGRRRERRGSELPSAPGTGHYGSAGLLRVSLWSVAGQR